ncbi:hypothetical protein PQ478_21620 (plasmid) [Alkalihalophilus pseudofirmus]|uniref:hypothetical protein n=1 Tax=Alkalihalophilus pseudofirmus TaxID=79885 RepID=UPI00259B998E|nr:hypothetical protein [Alkalihalophilus pseudofirmus]WEG19157.1 hypothetical protein PQ478_21620 [Alkalihalophilus pseudofirmus]
MKKNFKGLLLIASILFLTIGYPTEGKIDIDNSLENIIVNPLGEGDITPPH